MSVRYAFVTLLTSDAYLPGALTIAAALSDLHASDQTVQYDTVCLVTPESVDVSTVRLLRKAFDLVIGVEIIDPPDSGSLTLLGRPDLDTALTKLHVFRLTQYSKVIFLDADVLPLRSLSHLFLLDHEFSAVPDVGWPDIFNSGVMVLSPGEDKFKELQGLLDAKGSWDGADQGLLNEWRGSNWNRLSFTYNTTPTAIYTYAPAYQRFGSQISAVHFIGPHKPWHSIPYRAPGFSTQSSDMDMVVESPTETPTTQEHASDYGSLVDRWYSVYDRHYRSQAAEPVFQPDKYKYTSAWNEGDLRHAIVASGALDLEELRRAALGGMGAIGVSVPRAFDEGEYRTMPLEGRFDLIRPRTREERKKAQEQAPKDSMRTPETTAVPPEFSTTTPEPSTPPGQILSLPSGSSARWTTLPTPGVNEIPSAPHARPISLPTTPLRYVPTPYKTLRTTREVAAQTVSISSQEQEPGRTVLPSASLMWSSAVETPPNIAPTDTYFFKEWEIDRNLSPTSSDTSLTMEPSPSKPRTPPSAISIPSLISSTPEALRRQLHYRNITREENGSPIPDPANVKRVFPWEGRPRQAPRRVFPDEGSLLTALRHPAVSATPERKGAFRSPMPSPLIGFPPSFQPHYPPDSPFPQRYTSGVPPSVPSSSPLGLESEPDRVETGSQDGDVEDEVDSEEEMVMRSRMRSSSIEKARYTPKYRSIGVQTNPRNLREEGIQVTTFVPVTEVAEKLILMNKRLGRSWVTSSGTTSSPTSGTTLSSPSSPPTPTTLVSVEAGDLNPSSASSSLGNSSVVPSTLADVSPLSRNRKGSRVWDPARGVETFKRGSEQVLAKFMNKGS